MTCAKCQGQGAYGTRLCDCRKALPPREGRVAWWTLERVFSVDVSIPVGHDSVSISVDAEVPISAENYRVHRHGNRYYPTLIELHGGGDLTLHACTARALARALLDAAQAAERIDEADTDPQCGHWAPCDCREASAVRAETPGGTR